MYVCPLCGEKKSSSFHSEKRRDYYRCKVCQLVFVPPSQHLNIREEKAEYDLHQNDPDDADYRRFLSRLFVPVRSCLKPDWQGLDFGSGPGPALSLMFAESGFPMVLYDPFYAIQTGSVEKVKFFYFRLAPSCLCLYIIRNEHNH